MNTINEIRKTSRLSLSLLWKSADSKLSRGLPGRNSRLMLATGLALCANFSSVHAQTWDTVDDIVDNSARVYAATSDSAGNLFVAGNMLEASGLQHAVVMKSSDGGLTWDSDPSTPDVDEPADATVPPSDRSYAGFHAIAATRTASGEDHLVSAGRDGRVGADGQPPNPTFIGPLNGRWIVRRSLNAGATWVTLDQFTHPTYNMLPTWSGLWGAAVDTNGNIYVVGAADEKVVSVRRGVTTTTTVSRWLIRKGLVTTNGMVWSTVGDFAGTTVNQWDNQTTCPRAVACVGNNVFVVGSSGGSWVVRRSSDGGATWPVVDNFRLSTSADSQAYGIAADSAGNLYVAGSGGKVSKTKLTTNWIVRKGSPDGTGWVTVDQFLYSNGNAQAAAVTVDSSDTVHVTGSGWTASSATKRWITRQRSAATGLWTPTEDFSLATTGDAFGKAITADPSGNVFSAGRATDDGAVQHGWLVHRKPTP